MVDEVCKDRLMEHTAFISKEIRLSGSEEELRAFQYIKEQLESFGLTTEQTFQDAYISIPIKAEIKLNGISLPCITHSMAASTNEHGIEGELFRLEEGGDDPRLDGKIALLQGIALPSTVEKVESLGAIGAIFVNGPHTHEMIVSTVWGNPTPDAVYPTIPVLSVNNDNKEILEQNVGQICWIHSTVDTAWRKIPCLTAELKGRKESDKFLLFSGHVDSWHYGAMDNATANATMLEVARVLANHRSTLRRSIRFAFWSGHSHGRYAGSAAYCDTHWEEMYDHCFMHVYVDSVGGKGATILAESNCMEETKGLATDVLAHFSDEKYIGKRFARAGDQSFWGPGVPSLYMGMSEQPLSDEPASQALFKIFGGEKAGGFGWWWHTTEDTIDKIDASNLTRDCQIYLETIHKACSCLVLPIDQREAMKQIRNELENYQKIAKGTIDLGMTLSRLSELQAGLEKLYEKLVGADEEEAVEFNTQIMHLSRILVPLQYVEGDRFHHDKAIYQAPIPSLAPIQLLAKLEEGSHEFHQWKTCLVRNMNKLNYTLRQAILNLKQ
jgi:hypothetical protein